MANIVYNKFLANLANKIVDWEVDDIRVALVSSAYTPDKDHTQWSQVSTNEITGTAYTAGGEQLTTPTVTEDTTNDLAKLDGDDVTWQTSTITAYYAVLYDSTLAANDLCCLIDFGADKSSSEGDFKIQWNASGIMTIQQS
jgi:hypothetical protein